MAKTVGMGVKPPETGDEKKIAELKKENKALKKENEALKKENEALKSELDGLKTEEPQGAQ